MRLQKHNVSETRIIDEHAEDFLKLLPDKLGLQAPLKPPVPVEIAAKHLCGLSFRTVQRGVLGKETVGILDAKDKEILIDARYSLKSAPSRFTIAHEIGHWVLHINGPFPLMNNNEPYPLSSTALTGKERLKAEEIEANRFAAAFLVPESSLLEEALKYTPIDAQAITNLAKIFHVSVYTMKYRVLNLYSDNRWPYSSINWDSLEQLESGQRYQRNVYAESKKKRKSHRPAWSQKSKVIIEYAGLPNAGKDTQINIQSTYLYRAHKYRVAVIEEGFKVSPQPRENHLEQLPWVISRTTSRLLEYGLDSRHEIVIVNRGVFDFLALLHWWYLQGKISKDDEQKRAQSLLLSNWHEWTDLVLLLEVPPTESILREEASTLKTIKSLCDKYGGINTPPSPRIINAQSLSLLNRAYSHCLHRYKNSFKHGVHLIKPGSDEQVAHSIMELVHPLLPKNLYRNRRPPLTSTPSKNGSSQPTLPGLTLLEKSAPFL